jgi:hypothetical protein
VEKSNTKPKIWTPWTLIFVPVDQDVAGAILVSHLSDFTAKYCKLHIWLRNREVTIFFQEVLE